MEFYRTDIEARYADIIEAVDLQQLHADRYEWSAACRQLGTIAPELTVEQRNELIPVLCGLAFIQYGNPGGIDAVLVG